MELLRGQPRGSVLYKGVNWNVMTFQSTLFPLRAGEVTAAGTVTARAALPEADPLIANFIRSEVLVEMSIPEVKITAQELPEGAPASFTNAVGDFRISASTDARDLSANEPITVKIKVTGTGNIHSIACPALTDASNWKLYPPNKLDPGQNTRSIQGTVEFQQMMRPIAQTDAIPPFELTFFDPSTQQYKTVTTSPIPLEWKASAITGTAAGGAAPATPPPAGTIPVAEMTDIYGIMPAAVMNALTAPAHWGWYFLAYIPAVVLLGMALIRYIRRVQKESFTARERMRSFRRLSSTPRQASSTEFLRAAGNFIESYIPPSKQNEEMKTILQLRDDRAFKPSGSSDELPHAERQHMLQAIKKAIAKLPVLIMAAVLTLSVAGAAGNAAETDNLGVQAYEQGEYAKAIDYFSRESNDTDLSKSERAYASFGIGNSYYRMNKPGLAALNYRRALELSPYFTEARYNLQFVERKEGAILPANTTENQWLTYISHDALGPISILSGAVMLTFLVPDRHPQARGAADHPGHPQRTGHRGGHHELHHVPGNPGIHPGGPAAGRHPENARQARGGHEQPGGHHPAGIHPAHPARGTRLLVLRQHLPEHACLDTQDGRAAAVTLFIPPSPWAALPGTPYFRKGGLFYGCVKTLFATGRGWNQKMAAPLMHRS